MKQFLHILFLALYTFLPTSTTFASTPVSGIIATSTIWTKENSPYVITNTLNVPYGVTLTILPGTIVKLNHAWVDIYGTLISGTATSSEQVYFTSINNDSIGGDTNGDGTSTIPNVADWKTIYFRPSSIGDLHFTTITYSGGDNGGGGNGAIINENAELTLSNSVITKTTRFGIFESMGITTVIRSEISGAWWGISTPNPSSIITVHQSSIHGNSTCGICNYSSNTIDMTNNWWGDASGPRSLLHNASGTGDTIDDPFYDSTQFTPWLTVEPDLTIVGTSTPPQDPCLGVTNCNSNVLFLPGIEGSRLYEPDYQGGTRNLWEPHGDKLVPRLGHEVNGSSTNVDIYTKDVLDWAYVPEFGNVYKSFINSMNDLKATNMINDWEAIPYDWRLTPDDILNYGNNTIAGRIYYSGDNRATTTPYIIQELRRLARNSRTGKVTIIAHSNGGLVTKRLTEILGPIESAKLIDKIIFVAVPQVGTPKAIGAVLHGFDQALPIKLLSHLGISDEAARTLAKNMPMAYNLVPSQGYFTQVDDPVATFTSDPLLMPLRARYGELIHSKELLHNFITDTWREASSTPTNLVYPSVGNETLLTNAETLHVDLDNWAPPQGVQFYEIAGWGNETVRTIKYYQGRVTDNTKCHIAGNSGIASNVMCETKPTLLYSVKQTLDGDGTVVVPSALWTATSTGVQKYWLNLKEYNATGIAGNTINRAHADILEVDQLRDFIGDILQKKPLDNLGAYQYISTSTPINASSTTRLHYSLHSPLSLDLFDDQGNHTGISTSTGELEENVPDSHYEAFGELKYISVSKEINTRLFLNGYASGSFTLDVEEVQGDTVTASTTFSAIPCATSTIVTLDIPSFGGIASSSALHVDENGDGITDFNLTPKIGDIVTIPIITPDTTPPTTIASTISTLGKNSWYTSNVLITLTATDTESGIASTTYSLNNGVSWSSYASPLTIAQEGSTTVLYRSGDKAGNSEATNTLVVKIDKTAPEVRIVFDIQSQTLKFSGSDNLSSTTITSVATSTLLTDQAGNTLQVFFTLAKPKVRHSNITITKLTYNGVSSTASTSLKYKWNINPNGTYKMFAAHIASSTILIETHFRPKKNVTIMMKIPIDMDDSDTDDNTDTRPIKMTLQGMVVEGLNTNKGDINVVY